MFDTPKHLSSWWKRQELLFPFSNSKHNIVPYCCFHLKNPPEPLYVFVSFSVCNCAGFLPPQLSWQIYEKKKAVLLINSNNSLPHWKTTIKRYMNYTANRIQAPFVQSEIYFQILFSLSPHWTHIATIYSRQTRRTSELSNITSLLPSTIPQFTLTYLTFFY